MSPQGECIYHCNIVSSISTVDPESVQLSSGRALNSKVGGGPSVQIYLVIYFCNSRIYIYINIYLYIYIYELCIVILPIIIVL